MIAGAARTRVDPENPWPGLDSFTEEASSYFHGRSREAAELLRLVRREALTLLYGHSGLGKSSLLMAGLFPRLREADLLPVYARIDHSPGAPKRSEQLLAQLLEACHAQRVTAPPVPAGESLWGYVHRADAVFWSARSRPVVPVFVVDQFEEVFTLGRRDEGASAEFIQDLSDLVQNNPPRELLERLEAAPEGADMYALPRVSYKVVLSMREDFFPDFRAFGRRFRYGEYRLQPMTGEQALEAVLETGGRLVDGPVAHTIVRFLDDDPADDRALRDVLVEPALLSVVCSELNEKRKTLGRARIEPELLRGSQEAILLDFYARVTEGLDPRVRTFVQEKLISESGFRNSFPLGDAERAPGVTLAALAHLVDQRLLRVEERSGTRRVELTHDVLTGVVQEFRDRERRAGEVEQLRRDRAVARAKQRRTRALMLVFLVLSVGASGLAVWALALRRTAVEQTKIAQREKRNAEAAEGRAVGALAEVRRGQALLVAQRGALLRQRDSLVQREREILLQSEAADRFKNLGARIAQAAEGRERGVVEEWRRANARADSLRGVVDTIDARFGGAESWSTWTRNRLQFAADTFPAPVRLALRRLTAEDAERGLTAGRDSTDVALVVGMLAWEEVLNGNMAEGERHARRAVALDPESPMHRARLAHALYLGSAPEEARAIYRRFRGQIFRAPYRSTRWEDLVRRDVAAARAHNVRGGGRTLDEVLPLLQ
jgi:hypothetical protein